MSLKMPDQNDLHVAWLVQYSQFLLELKKQGFSKLFAHHYTHNYKRLLTYFSDKLKEYSKPIAIKNEL
jgi:hypothetical protein